MALAFADIAFTPSVRQEQSRMGSSKVYDRFLSPDREGGDELGQAEAEFITARDGFYQATVSETGWPYVQFRGGQPGFIKVIDAHTIAYADLTGNRQYISRGNLAENDRVSLILMDYPNRRRLKIWGRARAVDVSSHPGANAPIPLQDAGAPAERVICIHVEAFDWNCPRHIPVRLTAEEFAPHVEDLHARIKELQEENTTLRTFIDGETSPL